jgi:hypothetical protein
MSLKHSHKSILIALSFAAVATAADGTEYKTIPPLPKITVANFALSDEILELNTANSLGATSYWAGKLSISKTGIITGSATVENFDKNGNPAGKTTVRILAGSKVIAPATISPLNYKLELYNSDYDDYSKEQSADYRADVIIKFSNGFVARGKITYEHCLSLYANTQTINGVTKVLSYSGYNDSEVFPNISVTGPDGHIGFMVDN